MKCELSTLQKVVFYGSTIFYVIMSTSVFIIVGEITIRSILSVLCAVVLLIFNSKLCNYIELIDDDRIVAKDIMGTHSFTRDDVLEVRKYKMASIIILKYRYGSILLLSKMKNIDTLLDTMKGKAAGSDLKE